MKIILQPHLKIRLKQRLIPQSYPKKIVTEAEFRFFDPLTKHQIAIKVLIYEKKYKPMVVAYDIMDDEIQIITVYPTDEHEIRNRVLSRRWLAYEKN
ncbi:MAG: hypothetical protein Q7R97_02130 [Candidatus Daviesbacteria bacterium]|nr:hypothetical protein [Candidatus Daviesbacteria bacterium]